MQEKLPLDARLLSDAIIELNISRHNVSIYPRDHPLVNKSLNRAFDYLEKLFELRSEITIAVAKDTIIIDEHSLDKKNPVYRDFALHLNRMNIAYVTFINGLTKDELYSFHRFLLEDTEGLTLNAINEKLRKYNLTNIKVGFIDYSAFSFEEGESNKQGTKKRLWEWYVHGLLEGTLQLDPPPDELHEIPPEIFAKLLNDVATENLKEETYDRVIASYLRKSSERTFSGKDIKRLLNFIDGLKPELKRQFLSSSVREFSQNIKSLEKTLKDTSIDTVIDLLKNINEQKLSIPKDLKNLLDRFSRLKPDGLEKIILGGGLIADDITVSPDIINLLSDGNFNTFVNETYSKEIQTILEFDAPIRNIKNPEEFDYQWDEEYIEKWFNQTILEILSSDDPNIIKDEEYEFFNRLLKEQVGELISTAQYGEVLRTFKIWESRIKKGGNNSTSSYIHSSELISLFIDSLRISGRQNREEAISLCRYYDEKIIPPLMDALIEEESQTVRHFLLSLIIMFGDKAAPEAIKHLKDNRWYVKRNMLFILTEIRSSEGLPDAKTLCHHENPKVSFQAIKYLLRMDDPYGVTALREYLRKGSGDIVRQALLLAGAFKVKEVMPDLIKMLRKKALKGTDFYEKIPIVKALGQIGDPSALVDLKDILSSKSLLFKTPLKKLKEEIYSTLRNYPYEDVKDLIKDKVIQ
jgi:HEAT repeat protein